MRLLIVAATGAEIEPLIQIQKSGSGNTEASPHPAPKERGHKQGVLDLASQISFLITGVGMVATAYSLGTHLAANKYDLVINLGIAGSFDRGIALGEVVEVTEDTFAELGAEDDEQFIPLDVMGFGEITYKPHGHPFLNIKQVRAITVNTVHGNQASIKKTSGRLSPQLESMEGAAFFYACTQAGVPCVEIRAVSNYVEKRNRDAWQIGLAVKNLNTFAVELLENITKK